MGRMARDAVCCILLILVVMVTGMQGHRARRIFERSTPVIYPELVTEPEHPNSLDRVVGSEFDISSHMSEISQQGGFFVPVVEASGYSPAEPFDTPAQSSVTATDPEGTRTQGASGVWTSGEPVMCGAYRLAAGQTVAIRSPYYPDNYTENFDCTWSVKTDYTDLLVGCASFDLAEGDYLSIQYTQDTTLMYKGMTGPSRVFPSKSLTLNFHSDCRIVSKGMNCYVSAIGTTPEWATYPECGLPNRSIHRINGGKEAIEHQYPWQALLLISWSDHRVSCAGSLIHHSWVITAAHCLLRFKAGKLWTPNVLIHLGIHTRSQGGTMVVQDDEVMIHPKNSFYYDIALIRMKHPVTFSTKIRPICLPPRSLLDASPEALTLELAGWGLDETGNRTNELRVLRRYGMSSVKCRPFYPKHVSSHHFCTYSKDKRHICIGDSGGPVMEEVSGRLVLRGIISFTGTKSCSDTKPDGHISVPHFLDWIEQTTNILIP